MFSLWWLLVCARSVVAQIASLPVDDCTSSASAPPAARINISTVYAQISHDRYLNFTLLGVTGAEVFYSSNTTNRLLSTVFAPTSVLTFTLNPDSQSAFCQTLRPPSPLAPPSTADDGVSSGYCPLPPGPLAFAVATPLKRSFELTTLTTQIRVLDTSDPALELACVQLAVTPLRPSSHSVYGRAVIVFWSSVALTGAYWLVVGAGSLAAASKRGRQRVHNHLWSHIQGLGFVLASALSGEHFSTSPALLRFGTPSMRDVLFHTQWCSLLGMVAVQWPRFAYPFFAQTAWASLLYNVSFTQGSDSPSKHWYPLHTDPFQPPASFADQLADPASPLFLNASIPNSLFTLPPGIPLSGIPALAAAVGLRSQDAFDVAVGLFVLILAGSVFLSLLIFAIDWLVAFFLRTSQRHSSGTRTPPWPPTQKDLPDSPEPPLPDDDLRPGNVRFLHRPASRTLHDLPTRTGWLTHRLGQTSFHGSTLHGNLVRILILFHLPVSVFSCYQFSSGTSHSSLPAVILAALAFAVFSISLPAWLVFRLSTTPTSKLYDETGTLLALGPLYNHYAHASQLFVSLFFASNIAYSVVLGAGHRSGTAQSIIILVLEVASALTTSVWLPWARGATMGGISFILCVARIITAVLLVILSPVVSVGDQAGGWIAYAILVIQGLVYLGFLLMLIFKILEALVRLIWDVSFDRSKHTVDTGFIGAIALAGCCGSRRKHPSRRSAATAQNRPGRSSRAESDSTTQNMLPPVMHAVASHSRTTVSGPPSVLRPEQLYQPYREDSDDEDGYILGAWHYDDESPPPDPRPASPVPPTSGFSRVAGGRANIESPYTMAAGTRSTRSSANPNATASTSRPGASGANLPPGAMAPGLLPHSRKKSQSAIIEDAAALGPLPSSTNTHPPAAAATGIKGRRGGAVPGPAPLSGSSELSHDDDDPPHAPPRRWNWFGLFSTEQHRDGPTRSRGWHRRSRSEDAPMLLLDEPASPEGAASPTGRTFVVIRDRRPSPLSQAQVPGGQDRDGDSTRTNN